MKLRFTILESFRPTTIIGSCSSSKAKWSATPAVLRKQKSVPMGQGQEVGVGPVGIGIGSCFKTVAAVRFPFTRLKKATIDPNRNPGGKLNITSDIYTYRERRVYVSKSSQYCLTSLISKTWRWHEHDASLMAEGGGWRFDYSLGTRNE